MAKHRAQHAPMSVWQGRTGKHGAPPNVRTIWLELIAFVNSGSS